MAKRNSGGFVSSVYKYMSYREGFFRNLYLKISRFGEFNDPFEMLPGEYGLSVSADDRKKFYSSSNRLTDPDYYTEAWFEVEAGVRASYGVICFSAIRDSLLMWAHYADNHSGICVEIDSECEFFKGKYRNDLDEMCKYKEIIGYLKEVEYSSERPLFIDPIDLSNDISSWLVKSNEWSYENELRIILPLEHAKIDNGLLFYELSKVDIKSVIFGCKMSQKDKEKAFSLCESMGIKVKEAFVNPAMYKLDIIEYDPDNHRKFVNQYNISRMVG